MGNPSEFSSYLNLLQELSATAQIASTIQDNGPVIPKGVRRELAGVIVSWAEDIADRLEDEIDEDEMSLIRGSLDAIKLTLIEFDLKEDDGATLSDEEEDDLFPELEV